MRRRQEPRDPDRFHVGQRVITFDTIRQNTPPSEGEVVKVGRKLVHVTPWGRDWPVTKYEIESGAMAGDYAHGKVATEQEVALEDRERKAWERLNAVGLYSGGFTNRTGLEFTADELEMLATLVGGFDHPEAEGAA